MALDARVAQVVADLDAVKDSVRAEGATVLRLRDELTYSEQRLANTLVELNRLQGILVSVIADAS